MSRIIYGILLICSIIAVNVFPQVSKANPPEKTRILIILDCSGSMYAKWGKGDRMAAAKNILIHLVDSMKHVTDVELALRCYGHQHGAKEHNCQDSKLEVPFHKGNADQIIAFVRKVKPRGWTPIAYSLTQSAEDFPDAKYKNVIMLITDGLEECDGEPCSASKALQDKKITLKPYIIGIGLTDKMMKAFDCVGKNYNPKTEKDFGRIVSGVISQALDNTTLQVNLLDEKKIASVTNIPMSFETTPYGKTNVNLMHTMDYSGKPDTFSIDPNYTYNLKVFTVPPVQKKNIPLQTAHHNIITVDAPQGFLSLNTTSSDYHNIPCILRKASGTEIINVQDMNTSQKYLAGMYDLEILTLPKIKVKNVKIPASEVNKISIPDPGRLELTYKGDEVIGSIYVLRDQKQEWLFDFKGSIAIRKEIYLLQPGKYTAVFRYAKSNSMQETKQQNFTIASGGVLQVGTE